jgi:Mor family transcriptional regulator
MAFPARLPKSGPGTGGRDAERDAKICARRDGGLTYEEVGREFGLSREKVRLIVERRTRGKQHKGLSPLRDAG